MFVTLSTLSSNGSRALLGKTPERWVVLGAGTTVLHLDVIRIEVLVIGYIKFQHNLELDSEKRLYPSMEFRSTSNVTERYSKSTQKPFHMNAYDHINQQSIEYLRKHKKKECSGVIDRREKREEREVCAATISIL
ncbi:hypothetical protein Bca4012_026005 [Brassica carinata]